MASWSRACPGQQERLSAGSSWSLQELLSPVSLVQRIFLFLLQSFVIFISLYDTECKIISMAAPAADWLTSQLLLVSKVVEVARRHSWQELEPSALLVSCLGLVMLELGCAEVGEVPRAKPSQHGSGLRCAGKHLHFQS